MQYNLVRNGYFTASTVSGTGDVSLTWPQLESLMDGNLTSSGIALTASDVLYLQVDLSQRIKVDDIKLYASDLTKSADIKFYYKDEAADSYTELTTYSGSYYYAEIPGISAPRFVQVTVSGVDIDLYELVIYNDDYIVAFGTDGQMYADYMDDSPIGREGNSQAVPIYNNDTTGPPVTGYATIDYTGTDADNYMKISPSENGTYYSLFDGVLLEDNNLNSTYTWDMGEYSGIAVDNNKLKIKTTEISQKLGNLPNGSADEAFRTGANTWDWDRVNKKMYVMGLEGTTLGLWDYDYTSDGWEYLTNLAPAVAASDRFAVMSYCDGAVYVISKFDGTFGKYTISGAVNNWTNLANPTFSYVLISQDRVSMCSDGVRYIYALTSDCGQDTVNRNFKRFDTVSGTWTSMNAGYLQYSYSGGLAEHGHISCLTCDYDKDRVYLINASEEEATAGHYIQLYNVSSDSWGTSWFNVASVYNTLFAIESIWYHNKWLYVSCNPYFDYGYFFRYNTETGEIEKLNLGHVHYNASSTDIGGIYMIAIDSGSDFGADVYFAQINNNRKYLYSYTTRKAPHTYTSPIFKMDDGHSSSYFVIDADTVSGTTSVSYDENSYNGTIRVRSDDTEPIILNEVYWTASQAGGDDIYVYKYNLDTGDGGDWVGLISSLTYSDASGTAVNRRTGHVAVSQLRYAISKSGENSSCIRIFDRDGSVLYSKSGGYYQYYAFDTNMEFDINGGVWGYGTDAEYFMHFDNQLTSLLYSKSGVDYVYDFAVELNGDGVWYTDMTTDFVVHLNSTGSTLNQISLDTPRAICGTSDNGCWVIDNGDRYARRYNSIAGFMQSVYLGRTGNRMATDYEDGFWYATSSYVYHVNSAGTQVTSTAVAGTSRLKPMYDGCVAWNSSTDQLRYINGGGVIVRIINGPSSDTGFPAVFSHTYDDFVNYKTDSLPADNDPVWGVNGSLEWKEVRKDGYFLYKKRYHQVELTLRTDYTEFSPYVNKVIMAPAVQVQDIPSQFYKNVYVRTDIPAVADPVDHEARLKVWWGEEV